MCLWIVYHSFEIMYYPYGKNGLVGGKMPPPAYAWEFLYDFSFNLARFL